jgi:hypothetical protein
VGAERACCSRYRPLFCARAGVWRCERNLCRYLPMGDAAALTRAREMDLTIGRSRTVPRPGDFRAVVENGRLLLPEEVVDLVAGQSGVRSASEFLSWLETFPSAVAERMHWSPQDVCRATVGIQALLREHLDPAVMAHQPRGPVRVYGALDPRRRCRAP